MVTYYHFCVVVLDYTRSYMHIASPSLVRSPDSYPWRRAAPSRGGAAPTSICRSLMMVVAFSRTTSLC
jgi:hypothetical protein